MNRAARFTNLKISENRVRYETGQNSPANGHQGNTVQGIQHVHLHCLDCSTPSHFAILTLCSSPILLNEIQLAVILRVVVTNVTPPFDKFLECRFLIYEVRLREQQSAATAVCAVTRTLEVGTLGIQATIRPEPPLSDNLLHSLEPPRHCRMISRMIEVLEITVW